MRRCHATWRTVSYNSQIRSNSWTPAFIPTKYRCNALRAGTLLTQKGIDESSFSENQTMGLLIRKPNFRPNIGQDLLPLAVDYYILGLCQELETWPGGPKRSRNVHRAGYKLLSHDSVEMSNCFGSRTCDFYALGAVGIQDIFV